ncbi:MAG: RDD family protein [Lachnospiraceae bacterium]|nr:RDD family protein [Lachnospiraceae bacterium]
MYEDRNLLTAPLYTRVIAFLIDTVVAFLPVFVLMMVLLEEPPVQSLLAPALYAAPVEGTYVLREIPLEVNQAMNDSLAGVNEYAATEVRNVTLTATFCRMLSVFVILFYLFYDTVATVLFDGVTIGKYCMGIQTVYLRNGNPTVGILLRQLLGKIVLNSLGVFVISIISMLVTPKHYAIHDLIGGTRVVYMTTQKKKFSFSSLGENIRKREGLDDETDSEDSENEDDADNTDSADSDNVTDTAVVSDTTDSAVINQIAESSNTEDVR